MPDRYQRENEETGAAPAPLPVEGWITVADSLTTVVHGIRHAVVSQVLRPELSEFLPPLDVAVRSLHDARCCVTSLTFTNDDDSWAEAIESAPELPHLTHLDFRRSSSRSMALAAVRGEVVAKLSGRLHRLDTGPIMTQEDLDSFPAAPNLLELDLTGCSAIQSLAPLETAAPRLQRLCLKQCSNIAASSFPVLLKLRELTSLDLSMCGALVRAGLRGIEQLSELRHLCLSKCHVHGDDLAFIAKLLKLQSLDLSSGGYVPEGLCHIVSMPALRTLNVGNCLELDAVAVAHLATMTQLRSLDVNSSHGLGPAYFDVLASGLQNLESARFQNCGGLNAEGVRHIVLMPQLRSLDLGSCPGVDSAALALLTPSRLPHLRSLNLAGGSSVDDAGLEHVAGLSTLQELVLLHCSHFTEAGLAHVGRRMPQLTKLNLAGSEVNAAGMAHLVGLKSLRTLVLSMCRIIDNAALASVPRLPQLQELKLGLCDKFDSAGLAHIARSPRLRTLHLSSAPVTTEGLAHLSSMAQLRSLSLSHCSDVNAAGLAHVARLPRLHHLDLQRCPMVDAEALRCVRHVPDILS